MVEMAGVTMATELTQIPEHLPLLEALCWQTADIKRLTQEEMLHRYERGWHYRGVLADLGEEEQQFLKALCQTYGSWLSADV
jgi:hypothetical protein